MNRIMAGILSAILVTTAGAFAADDVASSVPSPAGKSIALVAAGSVDAALMDRVVKFVRENTGLNIRVLPAMEATGETFDAVAASAAKIMGAEDAELVVLLEPSADIRPHGAMFPEQRVAVVNVKSLVPANGDIETLGRRVEREVMQSAGLLLGMPLCPNPQCAMWKYSTDEELDAKGRNFCPPCMEALQKAAREKGVGADSNSMMSVE